MRTIFLTMKRSKSMNDVKVTIETTFSRKEELEKDPDSSIKPKKVAMVRLNQWREFGVL